MPAPAPAIIPIYPLLAFAGAFTGPTFAHAPTLLYGALLTPGRHTVASGPWRPDGPADLARR